MAGTVTLTKSSNFFGTAREKFATLALVSDDSDGSLPDIDLYGFEDCDLKEYMYDPDAVATPANTFDFVIVEKANPTRIVYESGSDGGGGLDATAFKREMSLYTGDFPRIDGPLTVKFVSPADHSAACDVGNSKEAVLKLAFEKK